jgi:hypothetical protein
MSGSTEEFARTPGEIVLRPVRLHWILDQGDDPSDDCAHSQVEFSVGQVVLVSPEEGDWSVSGAGLFLLRTIRRDHTAENPVGEQLFPCCGRDFALAGTEPETVCLATCPTGPNCWVRHVGGEVHLEQAGKPVVVVSAAAWRAAVFGFCDEVRAFYDRSLPKSPAEPYDAILRAAFVAEWDRMRAAG